MIAPAETDGTLGILLAACTGLGLAAACGFRVFVPLLVLSAAARAELVDLGNGAAWIGTLPALIAFAVATVLEVLAYFVPVVDNALDAVATPAAAIAGAVVASSIHMDVAPWIRWTFGVIAGAGIATTVQVPAAAARGGSTVSTAGVANSGVSCGELFGAAIVSALSVFAPIAVPLVLVAVVAGAIAWRRRRRRAAG